MSSNIVFNGVTYSVPADGDNGWGPDLTNYFISIASNALQKTGGTFTLTAEAAFGATYGLKATYFKSYGTNPAAAGAVRLANTESISWRNNANGADLALSSNASDALIFNSKVVLFSGLGLIVNADVSASAAIAYSKLNLSTSIVNADINASAAIAYSKLNLTGLVVNADIGAAAAIAYSKLAALTASRLLVSDGSGFVSVSAVTATEAGYLAGVTSAIQTQLNLLAPKASPTFTGTVTVPATITGPSSVVITLPTETSTLAIVGAVQTKTTTYTALVTDKYINCSGSAFTVTLYAASGNAGRTLVVKKTDAALANIITIDGNASETIDGALTTTLNTQYESITLYCDGSNWFIKNRTIPSVAESATLTHNLGGNGTLTTKRTRVGDSFIYNCYLAFVGAATATTLVITMESGVVIDTAKLGSGTQLNFATSIEGQIKPFIGSGWNGVPGYNDTTSLVFYWFDTNGNANIVTYNSPATIGNGHSLAFNFKVPVVGFKG